MTRAIPLPLAVLRAYNATHPAIVGIVDSYRREGRAILTQREGTQVAEDGGHWCGIPSASFSEAVLTAWAEEGPRVAVAIANAESERGRECGVYVGLGNTTCNRCGRSLNAHPNRTREVDLERGWKA